MLREQIMYVILNNKKSLPVEAERDYTVKKTIISFYSDEWPVLTSDWRPYSYG